MSASFQQLANFIWSVADLLRGPYEINFNRVFFRYKAPRPLKEIDAGLAGVEPRIFDLLQEVVE